MDCSKKGYPCIVIRTTDPVLLPLYRTQGQPESLESSLSQLRTPLADYDFLNSYPARF